ncbi:MAG: heavy metal sensor histidine kinase [Isosphaeraceae bacterium]
MSPLSIRWQLTLWYGVVLSMILVVFSGAVYLRMRHHLLALTDAALAEELADFIGDLGRCATLTDVPGDLGLRYSSHEGYEFQLSDPNGTTLFRSNGLRSGELPVPSLVDRETARETLKLRHLGHARLLNRLTHGPEGPVIAQTSVSLARTDEALRELLTALILTGPVALLATLGGGYLLARKALAPVDRMTATAAEITANRLDRRLDVLHPDDELGHLAITFNDMIARLQRSFDEVRRFTADAAHELRTPLAVMRTETEVALRSPRSAEQDDRTLEGLLEEIDRLSRLVAQLLFLSREDAGVAVGNRDLIFLNDVVREVAEHMQVVAKEKGLTLEVEAEAHCRVEGDGDRLRQLLFNLLDNALKATRPGGLIQVRAKSFDGRSSVTVQDSGIGIPAEHLPHLFDRFYRVDPARSGTGETEGTGLGLAICRAIAEAHHGRLDIKSTVEQGTIILLDLPTC